MLTNHEIDFCEIHKKSLIRGKLNEWAMSAVIGSIDMECNEIAATFEICAALFFTDKHGVDPCSDGFLIYYRINRSYNQKVGREFFKYRSDDQASMWDKSRSRKLRIDDNLIWYFV